MEKTSQGKSKVDGKRGGLCPILDDESLEKDGEEDRHGVPSDYRRNHECYRMKA